MAKKSKLKNEKGETKAQEAKESKAERLREKKRGIR
jgi:hypothetical protein